MVQGVCGWRNIRAIEHSQECLDENILFSCLFQSFKIYSQKEIVLVCVRHHSSSRFTATAFSPPSSRLCSDPLRCVVVRGLSPPSELGCSRVSRLCVCSSCASCSCCLPRLSPSSHLPVPVHLFQEQCITLVDPLSAHNAFADITL
ncbi:hypothetical protein AHAS_Ahas15G0325700 [Arachis hypogaea]